jgi:hypothetical protein
MNSLARIIARTEPTKVMASVRSGCRRAGQQHYCDVMARQLVAFSVCIHQDNRYHSRNSLDEFYMRSRISV